MKNSPETELATITTVRPDVVSIRFKDGITLTTKALAEVLELRKAHFGEEPHHVVLVSPAYLDFDLDVMSTNHCEQARTFECTRSVSWVANSEVNRSMMQLYYAYFPSKMPLRIVMEENDLTSWLASDLSGIAVS